MQYDLFSTQEFLDINDLKLNPYNYRFDPVNTQEEALIQIIKTRGYEKFINLAFDIAENKLNPTELIGILNDNDKLTVYEGNCRIASLKVLHNPNLIIKIPQVYKKIKDYLESKNLKIQLLVQCTVYKKEYEYILKRLVGLRHTGENRGIGLVKWDYIQSQRFKKDIDNSIPSVGIQILDILREDVKQADNFPISTLTRILDNSNTRKKLGINKTEGIIEKIPEKSKPIIRSIIDDLKNENIKVNKVYYKDQIKDYVENKINESQENNELLLEKERISNFKIPSHSSNRKTVFPYNFKVNTKDIPKLNDIQRELKNLDVQQFNNSCAMLLRAFIELSVKHYQTKKNIKRESEEKLNIISVANKILINSELDEFIKMVKADPIFKFGNFNGYVHYIDQSPSPDILKTQGNNYKRFLELLWNDIN